MFRHILVPLDGSGMAEAALPAAAFFAVKFNAAVTLLHVIERDAPDEVHGQPHLKKAEEATAYLRETAARAFHPDASVALHVHTTEVDDVAESIVAHAQELDHDIIIMCSHGRGRALHLLFGSIAQKVISKGTLPVLVTRHGEDEKAAPFSCDSLLLPLDGDAEHTQALPPSKELARACGSMIHLLVVIPGFGDLSGQRAVTSRFLPGSIYRILEMSVQQAEDYVQSQLEDLQRDGINAVTHVLRGDPAVVIEDTARKLQTGLIVMTTHGKSSMDAFWSGSVTHKLSSLGTVPILLIPVIKRQSKEDTEESS
ncbi:MAG: universal stress protein [Nitrospirae bacterium]|nr:universal stress protein [Nitrospirota bacterium]